eukprot:9775964-Alexandrium_andersonii.AAC.1
MVVVLVVFAGPPGRVEKSDTSPSAVALPFTPRSSNKDRVTASEVRLSTRQSPGTSARKPDSQIASDSLRLSDWRAPNAIATCRLRPASSTRKPWRYPDCHRDGNTRPEPTPRPG